MFVCHHKNVCIFPELVLCVEWKYHKTNGKECEECAHVRNNEDFINFGQPRWTLLLPPPKSKPFNRFTFFPVRFTTTNNKRNWYDIRTQHWDGERKKDEKQKLVFHSIALCCQRLTMLLVVMCLLVRSSGWFV